jgi:hypothetical protein
MQQSIMFRRKASSQLDIAPSGCHNQAQREPVPWSHNGTFFSGVILFLPNKVVGGGGDLGGTLLNIG